MITHIRWIGALTGIALISVFSGMSQAQQVGPSDNPMPRGDAATSGAGPTSSAPGQYNYNPPKSGSTTTDARGVTTTQPSESNPKPPASSGRRDDSSGAGTPK